MEKKLKRALGKVVSGDLFWDREKEKELFIGRIREGANILLVAQRRMGKTSLLAEVANILQDEFIVLFIDLQDAKSGPDAIAKMGMEIHKYNASLFEKIKGVFGNILDKVEGINAGDFGITLRAGIPKSDWTNRGDKLLETLTKEEKRIVIMIDELPILINKILRSKEGNITPESKAEAEEFMSWVRKNSIKHQGRISFVLSGSIGLGPVLHQVGLSATINNFVPFELPAWDKNTAVSCLKALGLEYGIEYEEGILETICNLLGSPIPHHVQMFFGHIYDRCKMKETTRCTKKDVQTIYQQDMLSARGQTELMHYEERLKMVLGEDCAALAFDMLTEAAVEKVLTHEAIQAFQKQYTFESRSVEDVQQEIIWVLEHDGYLRKNTKGYLFVSKLLRDWWKARYSNVYIPVRKRK